MTSVLVEYGDDEKTVVPFETVIGMHPGTRGCIRDTAVPALAGAAVLLHPVRATSTNAERYNGMHNAGRRRRARLGTIQLPTEG